MGIDERPAEAGIEVPTDLTDALGRDPEAARIWERLPEAHRRGHVIAIQRTHDAEVRAKQIAHTIEHLFEKHAS
jgi:uncharacterized protein YdeI (YjbR/CyaY-like superfamily)